MATRTPSEQLPAPPENAAELAEALGRRIRKLRLEQGLTLEDVATSSGLSQGSLSQIERGLGNPSFNTMVKIAHALGTPIANLLEATSALQPVVRRDSRRRLDLGRLGSTDNGTLYELLTPNLERALEVIYLEVPPGVSTETTPFSHEGEEVGFILEGRQEVHLDGRVHLLGEGDAISYSSRVPHWYRNPGPGVMRAIWIITPPTW